MSHLRLGRDVGHIAAENGGHQGWRVEQHHIITPQPGLAVGYQRKLRDGIIDGVRGANVQKRLATALFQAELRPWGRNGGAFAGSKAETASGRCRPGAEYFDGDVEGLSEV